MAARDPEVRTASATVAGLSLAASRSTEQIHAAMAHARAKLHEKWIAEIDPDGHLAQADPDELDRRLVARRRLEMSRRGLASARIRAARRAAEREAAADAEYAALAESEGCP